MKLYDDKKTVEIKMMVWENGNFSPDWSLDFFEAGGLPYNDEKDAYKVDDVDYCIDQAEDWKNCVGDFSNDYVPESAERHVFVDEI